MSSDNRMCSTVRIEPSVEEIDCVGAKERAWSLHGWVDIDWGDTKQ